MADDDFARELAEAVKACNKVLAKLATISEGATVGVIRPPVKGSSKGSRAPSSGEMRSMEQCAPSINFSPYAHFHWRTERAARREDLDALRVIAEEAEIEYAEYVGTWRRPQFANEELAIDCLLREYVGWPAERAAVRLRPGAAVRHQQATAKWVRRQRKRNKRDPETGEQLEADPLVERILALHRQGVSQKTIAAEVERTQGRVSQIIKEATCPT